MRKFIRDNILFIKGFITFKFYGYNMKSDSILLIFIATIEFAGASQTGTVAKSTRQYRDSRIRSLFPHN